MYQPFHEGDRVLYQNTTTHEIEDGAGTIVEVITEDPDGDELDEALYMVRWDGSDDPINDHYTPGELVAAAGIKNNV